MDRMQDAKGLHDLRQKPIDTVVDLVAAVMPQPVVIFITHDAVLFVKREAKGKTIRGVASA